METQTSARRISIRSRVTGPCSIGSTFARSALHAAEFLTGRYHPRGGVFGVSTGGERLDLDEKTIGDTFVATSGLSKTSSPSAWELSI